MGSRYYESELAYLREMGREFSLVHPSTAGLLAERGNDPDVERLLEGFAFLTARIREKIEDSVPSVIHGITELLLPHYLRPIPATSIIQYAPTLKTLRGAVPVPRGTRVASTTVQGSQCSFRTTQDVSLLPLELVEARLDETAARRPVIRLTFETTEAGRLVVARKEGFRFLLHGELAMTSMLALWLRRYLTSVEVTTGVAKPISLGKDALVPIGWDQEHALLPWPDLAPPGYRYLQEYFTLPEKFLFFDVKGLDAIELVEDRFEVAFTFDRPPAFDARMTTDNFRLHCTPVINLFEISGDPVRLNPLVHEHLLRAGGIDPRHAEVYGVESVIGVRQGQVQRRTYPSFVSYRHAMDSDPAYYKLRRTESPLDDATDVYIAIETPRDVAGATVEETLSIDLSCTNRNLPSELQLGEISVAPRGASSPAPFKNIVRVSAPARPPLGAELHWRLMSHFALGRQSLAAPGALVSVLSLYNFQRDASPVVGRANEAHVESIREVKDEAVTRMLGGAPVRGMQTRVEVEESRFSSEGEAFLFGCVLDEFMATHATLNSFNELKLVLHPSKTELRWPARSGDRRIL
ncbi:MAG: type VI secretion system baseplate subunit TssF [Nannocystaceae bacterium]|nr:type VI secretion system baseplate subunit TssF [Nannocystaceae bacterium]